MLRIPSLRGKYGQKIKQVWDRGGKPAVAALVVVVVFVAGVNVGNGNISVNRFGSENGGLPSSLDYSSVQQVYRALVTNYDGKLTTTQLLDGIKTGMVAATGDPYTVYLDAKDANSLNSDLNGTFSGVGAELGQNAKGDLIVISPIAGYPAAKAGLRAQDIITEINGQSTQGMSAATAVTKIRGPKGTKVTLRVLRGQSQDLSFTMVREDIHVPSVNYSILPGNIGYMQITQFNEDTSGLAQKAAQEFKDKGVKGVVLDLRGNPGGLLTAAVDVSSLWLPQGATILQERRGNVVMSTETATGNNLLSGLPTAVLIDAGSASASEITAGALKDNNVATLFGAKSFGKGSVQQILQMSGGAELKVTIARWYRLDGQNIDKKGITPDHVIPMTDADYKSGQDPQKDAAINFVKSKIN